MEVYAGGTKGSVDEYAAFWAPLFRKGSIVRRECDDCANSQKDIFYLRLTNTVGIEPRLLFLDSWSDNPSPGMHDML